MLVASQRKLLGDGLFGEQQEVFGKQQATDEGFARDKMVRPCESLG